MKKLLYIIGGAIVLVIIIAIAGGGGEKIPQQAQVSQSTHQEVKERTTSPIQEKHHQASKSTTKDERVSEDVIKRQSVAQINSPIQPEAEKEIASSAQKKPQTSEDTAKRGTPLGNPIEEGVKEKDTKTKQKKKPASPEISVTTATVDYVIDGDTIILTNGERVRYLGINAPEKGQPYSTEATRANERWVGGKRVKLELDIQTRDRYGRLLAYVWVGKTMVNEELVKEGYAVSETIQPNVKYQGLIVEAQKEARKSCRGLWEGICNPKVNKSCIRIANINADAPGNDNYNKNGEWIEIKNTCSNSISMNEWLIKDNSASNRYRFRNFTLKGGSSVIIYSGYGTDTQDELYWANYQHNKYAIWNNTGDHAFIYNAQGTLVDDYQY